MARITQSQLAKTFHRLATSYAAGIDIRTILDRETETGGGNYRSHMKTVADGVDGGASMAKAMQSTDGYFPDLAISVVHAGERGGRLEESFQRLANHYSDLVSFRNKLLAALAWPAFELFAAIVLVGGMMAICDWIFDAMEMEKINWLLMGSTVGNVIAYFVLVGFLIAGCIVLVMGTARGWFGTLPMQIARKIPLIGGTIEALSLSRFAWTMSVAENAGMNPVQIATLALRSTENYFYKQFEDQVARSLQDGNGFYKTFAATHAFPRDFLIYVDNGETAGELAETMDRASHEYQQKADINLKLIGTIGFVCMLLFVGLLVLIIAVFAMQQYINMLNSLM